MKKILIVDDCDGVREFLSDILNDAGFEIIEAIDGHHALEILQNDTNGDVCAILADYNMPNCNGLELAQIANNRSLLEEKSFFIMSAQGIGDLKPAARENGVVAWINKPFNNEKLISCLKQVVDRTKVS